MATKDKIACRKLSLLDLASELSNVSRACKVMGYSRQQFYEIRRNFQTYGAEGLIDRLPGAKGPHPNRVPAEIEQAVRILNNDVIPTLEAHGGKNDIVLSDNGREFCGWPDQHPDELFREIEEIGHRLTKVRQRSPTVSWSVSTASRSTNTSTSKAKDLVRDHEMQIALDEWLVAYNTERPHLGYRNMGRRPWETVSKFISQEA